MRVLFLTVSTGQGHTSCAKAIDNYLHEKNVQTYFLDIYGYIHPMFSRAVSDVYLFASGKVPKLYGKCYDKEDYGNGNFINVVSKFNNTIKYKILKFIKLNSIDAVVCTHILAAQVMTMIKDKVNIPIFGIVTDYTIHPKWETTYLDYCVIADKSLIPLAKRKGLDETKLLSIGIPVDLKFAQKHDKAEMKRKLGFDDKPLIFVMMGSMGYGNILNILAELDQSDVDCNVAVVCGNNGSVKDIIDQTEYKLNIKAFGFVNNVDEFMDAAECIVTKPGGLSVTESLSKQLPMIYIDPIPGQEFRNVEFLVNNGVGLMVSNSYSLSSAVSLFFHDVCRANEIRSSIKRLSKPYAARDLGEIILKEGEKRNAQQS